jgi:hypothetical protein
MTDYPHDDLLETFEGLRERVKIALRRVMEIRRKQPHYAAALIVVVGCEALGLLLYNDKKRVFVKDLIGPHKRITKKMAADLFDALRNGLAHNYDTNFIRVGEKGPFIDLVVSWTRKHRHLSARRDPPGIYLNLPTMKRNLERIFNHYRTQLRDGTGPRRTVPEQWARSRYAWGDSRARRKWRDFVAQAKR